MDRVVQDCIWYERRIKEWNTTQRGEHTLSANDIQRRPLRALNVSSEFWTHYIVLSSRVSIFNFFRLLVLLVKTHDDDIIVVDIICTLTKQKRPKKSNWKVVALCSATLAMEVFTTLSDSQRFNFFISQQDYNYVCFVSRTLRNFILFLLMLFLCVFQTYNVRHFLEGWTLVERLKVSNLLSAHIRRRATNKERRTIIENYRTVTKWSKSFSGYDFE